MRVGKLLLGTLLGVLPALIPASLDVVSTGGISGASAYTEKSATYSVVQGVGVQMSLVQTNSAFGLNFGTSDFTPYTDIALTLTNSGSAVTQVEVVFDSGSNGWAWSDFVIGANKTETVTIPLQPSSVVAWGNGFPTGDGTVCQSSFFGTIVKNSVHKIRIWNPLISGVQHLTLSQLALENLNTPTSAIVDQYGQPNYSFAGRITSDSQLASQILSDNALSGQLPYSNDAFDGVAGSGIDAGTGKWRVAKQNGKWYIITPVGTRFFSTGVACVGNGSRAFCLNNASLFATGALPAAGSPLDQFYFNTTNPNTGQPDEGFDFYTSNLERKYGSAWQATGDATAVKRLKTWGFNTLGPASDGILYNNPSIQMPNMQVAQIAGNFRTITCPGQSFIMPDPYDPNWATAVNSTLAPLVPTLNRDPYNVGLFVDNELPWAQSWTSANYRFDLAFNVLSAPSDQPAKQRFEKDLLTKYRTIAKLNSAWGTSFASFNALLANTSFRPAAPSLALQLDMRSFLTEFANQYFSIIRAKLTSLGYHGLYLGCRFAYYCPEAVAAAVRYCDVVSFNCYDMTPSQYRSDLKAVNAPVLISEFAFSASDQGRVGGSSLCCPSEDDRVQAYQNYVADASTWPNLVGLQWYKWEDEVISGRMWDNSNQDLGIVSVTDVPYSQLVAAMAQANTAFNTRMLTP
ncbi:MAG TPA: hypothetical protein VMI31_01595 [Fimbriimonadaceae bacterium]|nr:hypothetical protein [Fimbriimonadaceae bacterium]